MGSGDVRQLLAPPGRAVRRGDPQRDRQGRDRRRRRRGGRDRRADPRGDVGRDAAAPRALPRRPGHRRDLPRAHGRLDGALATRRASAARVRTDGYEMHKAIGAAHAREHGRDPGVRERSGHRTARRAPSRRGSGAAPRCPGFCSPDTACTRGARRQPTRAGTSKAWSSSWPVTSKNGDCDEHDADLDAPRLRRERRRETAGRHDGPRRDRALLGAQSIIFEQLGRERAAGARRRIRTTILAAYAGDIARLKSTYGYTTADVIRVTKETPNVPALREKFFNEHTHSEDEVRFFVEGSASFYLRTGGKVFQTICTRGDLIGVPGEHDALVRHGSRAGVRRDPPVRQPRRLGRELHRRRRSRRGSRNTSEARRRSPLAPFSSTSRGRRARSRSCTTCSFRMRTSTSTRTSPRTALIPTSRPRCSRRRSWPANRPTRDDATCSRTCTSGCATTSRRRRSRRCKG